jgi:hypothetical protein
MHYYDTTVYSLLAKRKSLQGEYMLCCGAGGMFSIRWTRVLLSIGSVMNQRVTILHID